MVLPYNSGPTPDFDVDDCDDCGRRTRVFQFGQDYQFCLSCYREMVTSILADHEDRPEGEDAAA
jgi:hypothetical protein